MFVFFCVFLFFVVMISSIFVVNIFNPVHSVFFLVLTFLSGALFFFIIRNEFIAIIFIIVYIGAISVLFLFVIMLLDVKIIELKSNTISYIPLSFVFIVLLFIELNVLIRLNNDFIFFYDVNTISYTNWLNFYAFNLTNVHILGYYIYTYYFLLFLFCGFLLFIATIGAILLTFVSFKNTSYVYDSRHEAINYHYFVSYDLTIYKNY